MFSAQIQFKENLKRVRALGNVAAAVQTKAAPGLDVSDLWRAQIVMAVSALDHYIHELARLGMIEIAKGLRPKTDAYLHFDMPILATESALSGASHNEWIGETVRAKHSWQSFQDPDKLADAIRLISSVKLWEAIGNALSIQPKVVKTRLKLVVDRRNKIAHEADSDPANPGFRWPIDATMANETVDFLENVGDAIYKVVV